MGLALEELEDTEDHIVEQNAIKILLDERIKSYIDTGPKVIVDYRQTPYGEGFIIDGESTC